MSSSEATPARGGRGHRAPKSRSKRAKLEFPVGRIHRYLREGKYGSRIGSTAPVFLAAVLEYLVCEVLELAGNEAKDCKKGRITPTQIQMAVQRDDELDSLLANVMIPGASLCPHIHCKLLPKTGEGNKQGASTSKQRASTSF